MSAMPLEQATPPAIVRDHPDWLYLFGLRPAPAVETTATVPPAEVYGMPTDLQAVREWCDANCTHGGAPADAGPAAETVSAEEGSAPPAEPGRAAEGTDAAGPAATTGTGNAEAGQ